IREIDTGDQSLISEILTSIDEVMDFYKQMGIDIVRVKEIFGLEPNGISADLMEEFSKAG
ncbi:MAG: hypothetical protein QW083_01440, partial [Methanomassiliicoccales archaeon]